MPMNFKQFLKHAQEVELVRDLFFTFLLALGIRFTLLWPVIPYTSVLHEVFLELLVIIGLYPYRILYKLWPFRRVIKALLNIYRHTDKNTRGPLVDLFLQKHIETFHRVVLAAFGSNGVDLEAVDVDLLSQLCFELGNGIYYGTDSHTPSEFKKRYPQYLTYQEKNLQKQRRPGIRILTVSDQALRLDFNAERDDFVAFYERHRDNSIQLLQVEPEAAKKSAKQFMLASTDIGIWDSSYAVIFDVQKVKTTKIFIRTRNFGDFKNCRDYFLELLGKAREVAIRNARLELLSRSNSAVETDKNSVRTQWDHADR